MILGIESVLKPGERQLDLWVWMVSKLRVRAKTGLEVGEKHLTLAVILKTAF